MNNMLSKDFLCKNRKLSGVFLLAYNCKVISSQVPIGRKRGRECTGSENRAYSMCSQVALPLRYRDEHAWRFPTRKITNSIHILWRRQFINITCTVLTSRGYHPIANAPHMNIKYITLTFYLTLQWRNVGGEY